ncbi:MAG: hypothetical protein K1X86_02795 [Ignavibacteria bacterium]|nr:hypothetical protein [Ignavibacteria bacterium]
MIKSLREKYIKEFTQDKYEAFLKDINSAYKPIEFKISETPVFIPAELRDELSNACIEILDFLKSDKFKELSKNAIPPGLEVPNESANTELLAIDFAVTKDNDGNYLPQLIELQGFASLYCYQELLDMKMRAHFDIPENYTHRFRGLTHETYLEKLKKTLIGDENPENVILLEIEPDKQKTAIDFWATHDWLGITPVHIGDIEKEGKKLFYHKDGKKIQIKRIYNRVIYDELKNRSDVKYNFKISEDLDVKWVSHPNWFFKISKYILPFIKSKYAPESIFLSELKEIPADLENYVLKPLFSFAGVGVIFDVKKEDIENVKDRENFVLQKKITYAPVVETLDEPAKVEIRILFLWNEGEEPVPVINLVRMGKGKMMGVDFNKGKTWVGSSIGYFPKG